MNIQTDKLLNRLAGRKVLRVEEAAEFLTVSRRNVLRLLEMGLLEAGNIGKGKTCGRRALRVTTASFKRLLCGMFREEETRRIGL